MPGLTGVVGGQDSKRRLAAAVQALSHFERYRSKEIALGARAAIGQVWRDRDRSTDDWAVDSDVGVAVMLSGWVSSTGPVARRIYARAVLESYLRDGSLDPLDFDGGFVIAVIDTRRDRVTLYNDRLGTLPVHYMGRADSTVFAPEAKALFAAFGIEPQLSATGVVSFLNCGYCLGKTTLFERVAFLEPGSRLDMSMSTGSCAVTRYWRIVFEPARALRSRRAAEDALHQSVRRAHELTVGDSENGYDILLSGGWDSRGMLAFLHAIGRLPSAAIAWGRTKDVPDSDPYLAERLARRFGLPFKFVAYDSDELLENAESWCRLSELATDNTGWFAEGATLLASGYTTNADFSLVGDETWGWSGLPRNEHDVRSASLPAALGGAVESCLAPAARQELAARYDAEVEAVIDACRNDHPLDRRDFLYLHGRVARFIFALGYYKELTVAIRRPFLLAGVLEVMRQVPRRFRIDKNLYISMLARFFPEVAAVPPRRASSLPEWSRDIRRKPELRRYFLGLLDAKRLDGMLGSLLDIEAIERLKATFFNEPVGARSTTPTPVRVAARKLPLRLRQRLRATGLHPDLRRMTPGYPVRGPADLLRCVAFLSLLQRTLRTTRTMHDARSAAGMS